MNHATPAQARHHYQIESRPVARGGFAWSVFEKDTGGGKVMLANGVMFPQAGEGLDHDALVSFVQTAESLRQALN